MATGLSINIGLNQVDPSKYNGWNGALGGCIPDARDMADIAKAQGFPPTLLTDGKATAAAVLNAISDAAAKLQAGDYLLLTYSGHGGQVPDRNSDETDAMDETWVLFDRQLLDDELDSAWGKFRAGVNILVLSDSCHSGTVTRAMPGDTTATPMPLKGSRRAPLDVCDKNYRENQSTYDQIQATVQTRGAVLASVQLISGCQDNQLSGDTGSNGVFTNRLKVVWKNGAFQGDHPKFVKEINASMPAEQTPNLFWNPAVNPTFSAARPFTIPATISNSLPPTIALKATINGRFVCAESGGNAPLIANRTTVGRWETFDVQPMGTNRIALKSRANGKYVCAERAGSMPLLASRNVAYPGDSNGNGSWEIFEVHPMGPGRITLKATVNGKFVCAENAGLRPLIASRSVAYPGDLNGNGSWEIFTYQAV